jgi:AAA domain
MAEEISQEAAFASNWSRKEPDDTEASFNEACEAADRERANSNGAEQRSKPKFKLDGIPLHIDEWLSRDLPEPDGLIGKWLTSTSRAILNADTGLGKTNFAMALGGHGAAGVNFLHWQITRPIRVLYVDGEMSNRLLKLRAGDVVRRLPVHPKGLHLLNRQDAPELQPLNTAAGAAFIHEVIDRVGGIDMIKLDRPRRWHRHDQARQRHELDQRQHEGRGSLAADIALHRQSNPALHRAAMDTPHRLRQEPRLRKSESSRPKP